MSVIFSVDGLEFLFTFRTEVCASAVGRPSPSIPATNIAMVDLRTSRRLPVKRWKKLIYLVSVEVLLIWYSPHRTSPDIRCEGLG